MITMAQHPQQQRLQHGGSAQHDSSNKQQDQSNKEKTNFIVNANNIKTISNSAKSASNAINIGCNNNLNHQDSGNGKDCQQQQQLQGQDGKRTLIKNQLYLIEQLQLENANLRNERDQLQLENEELKFQLQMISSSNILSQPGAAFNDRQLEKLVENNEGGVDKTSTTTNTITSNSSLTKITAKPLRQPTRPKNADNNQPTSSTSSRDKQQQFTIRSSTSALHSKGASIGGAPIFTLATNGTGNKSLSAKSASLSAFNVKSNLVLQQNDLTSVIGQDDDDQLRVKLVEQRYGDSEKVQAAAIVIQRAFRKYQICKRFRTITEQLRHTCQSLSSPHQSSSDRHRRDTNTVTKQQQQSSKSPSNDSVPFASGATRAAAWESLSYAASRLAASAAAATATTKQALVNGVTKSASTQQVASAAAASQQQSSQRTIASNQTITNTERTLKSDPVVAAAINFQQLESIRKRQYRVGLNIFNKNPEKGVSFLIAHSFIEVSPPYAKNSPSYYLSNQLHFIDKQHLAKQQTISSAPSYQSCQLCYEEENLKRNVAHFLLHRKGLAKEKIGQYLGNLQLQFNQDILKYYLQELDFHGLQIDAALRKFSSTLRLPGEAQKIERFVDCFAQRYVQCQQQQATNLTSSNIVHAIQLTNQNQHQLPPTPTQKQNQSPKQSNQSNQSNYKNNLTLLSKDEIFILTFAIIMLNTDLHSPSLKPTSRMSASQFVHNLRGVFKSQMISESDLIEIYERVKANQITTTPDHVTHVMKVQQGLTVTNFQRKELPNLCVPHRRLVCFCRLFEVYDINKKERVGQHQREIFLFNDLLLVTKLARRARANTPQQYTYRQSIPLQGLYVQLFQSTHYNFGIRLCQRSNDETLIMFNARNELDQSSFVNDLTESIAEMDEMESIRAHNIIETIHFKHQERLRRHAMMHNSNENVNQQPGLVSESEKLSTSISNDCDIRKSNNNINHLLVIEDNQGEGQRPVVANGRRLQSKFNSMSNLSSVAESRDDDDDNQCQGDENLRQKKSYVQPAQQVVRQQQQQQVGQRSGGTQRSCSIGSVHSLDSGLFLSRDVSPNQSS